MSDLFPVPSSIGAIKKRFGEDSIFRLNSTYLSGISVIPTGSLNLDLALGVGGIPRGRITEVYGPERSGKSTLCQNIVAQAQALGDLCAYVDPENALDPAWAKLNGVDVDSLYLSQPETGEQGLEIVEMLLEDFGCIIVDSVSALVPKAELEGDMGDAHMALQARLMGQAMRKLVGKVKKSNAALIFTNQLRDRIGVMFGSPETTSGGKALRYFASVRLDIRKREDIKDGQEVIGNRVEVKVKKNKVAPPYGQASFRILYNSGLFGLQDVLDLAEGVGAVERGGSYYKFNIDGEEIKIQGKDNFVVELLKSPGWAARIENQVREAYGLPLYTEELSDDS